MQDLMKWPKIHYTKLVEPSTDSPIYEEVKTFHRELPRLLAEGHEGKWALIHGKEVIGLFETLDDGYRAGREQFLFQPFIVQPVSEWQPMLRTKYR